MAFYIHATPNSVHRRRRPFYACIPHPCLRTLPEPASFTETSAPEADTDRTHWRFLTIRRPDSGRIKGCARSTKGGNPFCMKIERFRTTRSERNPRRPARNAITRNIQKTKKSNYEKRSHDAIFRMESAQRRQPLEKTETGCQAPARNRRDGRMDSARIQSGRAAGRGLRDIRSVRFGRVRPEKYGPNQIRNEARTRRGHRRAAQARSASLPRRRDEP